VLLSTLSMLRTPLRDVSSDVVGNNFSVHTITEPLALRRRRVPMLSGIPARSLRFAAMCLAGSPASGRAATAGGGGWRGIPPAAMAISEWMGSSISRSGAARSFAARRHWKSSASRRGVDGRPPHELQTRAPPRSAHRGAAVLFKLLDVLVAAAQQVPRLVGGFCCAVGFNAHGAERNGGTAVEWCAQCSAGR
jgi:hypothetical protein